MNADPLDALLSVDVESYLPYDLLVKMDIASMANSLEARSPFLDHQVLEFAARLPSRYKARGATLKYLLKQVGKALLPPANVRRRKMGFGVPVGRWMRGSLRQGWCRQQDCGFTFAKRSKWDMRSASDMEWMRCMRTIHTHCSRNWQRST